MTFWRLGNLKALNVAQKKMLRLNESYQKTHKFPLQKFAIGKEEFLVVPCCCLSAGVCAIAFFAIVSMSMRSMYSVYLLPQTF